MNTAIKAAFGAGLLVLLAACSSSGAFNRNVDIARYHSVYVSKEIRPRGRVLTLYMFVGSSCSGRQQRAEIPEARAARSGNSGYLLGFDGSPVNRRQDDP